MNIKVHALRQGLYTISVNGKNVGLISNTAGKWYAYRTEAGRQVGAEIDVTRILHRPELIDELVKLQVAY